jgi:Cdc6-like AAA superfamily ATPase
MTTEPPQAELDLEEQTRLGLEAGRVFSPAAPINQRRLFAGRTEQVRRVIDAINQPGQHVLIYGERGVGKTSMANVLAEFLRVAQTEPAGETVLAVRVNCDSSDDYSSLWRKVFSEVQINKTVRRAGFGAEEETVSSSPSDTVPDQITPDIVRRILAQAGRDTILIVIIDEFDNMPNGGATRLFADTIKMLSDQLAEVTTVLVGVADSVDQLLAEHQSVERALVQVRMPRMNRRELNEIVNNALAVLEMQIDDDALDHISALSQGLPHYTHLIGLHAARQAIDGGTRSISLAHVETAIVKAIKNAQQSIISAYHKATTSPRKDNLFPQALLACALAKADDLGYFAASDVRDPMSAIMKEKYDVPAFARHLKEFRVQRRGPILQRTGEKYRYRFRFLNPLIRPYIVMQGLSSKLITREILARLTRGT